MIRDYTREAGVRNLEREIAKLARKAVTKIVRKSRKQGRDHAENLEEFLGVQKYRYGLAEAEDQIGVVTGLAWTIVGGDLLQIEALRLPGKGRMKTTGKLGDVMKESIDAALSYVRSICPQIGVKPPKFDKMDIHVHVPDGATPKDGPSAGLGDGDVHCVGSDADPGAQGYRDDRRGVLARQRDANWRLEGKAAGGLAGGHQDGADPARERERPARDP